MVSVLKNPPACLLFHARHAARLGGLAMLPAILRKSLRAGTASAPLTAQYRTRIGRAERQEREAKSSRLVMRALRIVASTRVSIGSRSIDARSGRNSGR